MPYFARKLLVSWLICLPAFTMPLPFRSRLCLNGLNGRLYLSHTRTWMAFHWHCMPSSCSSLAANRHAAGPNSLMYFLLVGDNDITERFRIDLLQTPCQIYSASQFSYSCSSICSPLMYLYIVSRDHVVKLWCELPLLQTIFIATPSEPNSYHRAWSKSSDGLYGLFSQTIVPCTLAVGSFTSMLFEALRLPCIT